MNFSTELSNKRTGWNKSTGGIFLRNYTYLSTLNEFEQRFRSEF